VSAKKHTVKVTILGEEYTLRSETPPEHARSVAKYLDSAIREVMSSGHVVESNRAAILAALRITAELFEARASSGELTAAMTSLSSELKQLLPPSKREAVSNT
jgi:cell division protein ZapA